jgi:hypothetical protein
MAMKFSYRSIEYTLAIGVSVFAIVVYIKTICPTVDLIDSGELATVAYTLGIAHPTGYPLFTLVGWIFSHLPLGLRVIYQLNLMAAFFCSLGLFFFFRFLVFFLSTIVGGKKNDKNEITSSELWSNVLIPSIGGTLLLAFSETYWSTALSIEVYSLHTVFLALLLYLFTKVMVMEQRGSSELSERRIHRSYWFGFAYVLGLAFTNHMTIILLAPALLYYFFAIRGFDAQSWKEILKLSVPFLIGFSVYLYLPVRSSSNPILNWGQPIDLERFFWHWTGKVYRVWLFASSENATKQLKYFFDTLPQEFAYFPLIFSLAGLWSLWKVKKKLFVYLVLLFVGCVAYSINYDIHDIDSYFLLAYFSSTIAAACGFQYLMKNLQWSNVVKGVMVISISLLPLFYNYTEVDESDQTLVEQYTKDMFESIEPNGLVISFQWDYFVSASYYLQKVESYRPDVIVIDKELLRRSWYFNQLETNIPGVVQKSKNEINIFLKELYKFEHDLPYDSRVIESYYNAVIHSIIAKNIQRRPVYVTEELEPQYSSGYQRVPAGLAYRLLPEDTTYHELNFADLSPSFSKKQNKYMNGIIGLYKSAFLKRAMYLYYFEKNEEALKVLEIAKSLFPDFNEAIGLEQRIKQSLNLGR